MEPRSWSLLLKVENFVVLKWHKLGVEYIMYINGHFQAMDVDSVNLFLVVDVIVVQVYNNV